MVELVNINSQLASAPSKSAYLAKFCHEVLSLHLSTIFRSVSTMLEL